VAKNNPLNEIASLLGSAKGGGADPGSALNEQLVSLTQQLQQLQTVNQTQIQAMQANTQAVAQSTESKGQSTADSVATHAESALGFGLGLSPLISGLVSLFGGGGDSQPEPLVPYVAPLPIQANAGISASAQGAIGVDTADGGMPRALPAANNAQITVQVQAMDSKSFLDHSNDIAMAVRQAMLESTTLNDVIREV
jgi:hypothetical protein